MTVFWFILTAFSGLWLLSLVGIRLLAWQDYDGTPIGVMVFFLVGTVGACVIAPALIGGLLIEEMYWAAAAVPFVMVAVTGLIVVAFLADNPKPPNERN